MKRTELKTIIPSLALLLALPGLSLSIRANPSHDSNNPSFPKLNFPGILHGADAIHALGPQLPAVAQSYGHTPAELSAFLLSDRTLHVDEHGRLLYLEDELPVAAAAQTALETTGLAAAAPYPLADTFSLHSRPGANRVIYLDFDGYVLTGTAWNGTYSTINCPPWDIDGDPSSFSDSERTIIQGIWQRVAEDYLPFDVDVTTEYPGESAMTRTDLNDANFGVRVLISPISQYFGSYGGISYVGVFDYTSDYYKPALVFPENLANNEKYIAEAVSHEAGHTLGLSHDGTTTGTAYYAGSGTGETGWAPIMGCGYYQNLTQWSKGEYAYANNTEDDLAVMQNNGIAYRADDHGNTIASATVLPAGTVLSASGIIERNTDIDYFGFVTGAGSISVSVTPSAKGPNLDVLVQLYNANGSLVASSNPIGALAATISTTVPAGTYYLAVRGIGQGDPLTGYSSYDSLGAYTVSGTVVAVSGGQPPTAVIKATPLSGSAPLLVQFDASQSSDPDGTITSYQWSFGDGASATGVSISHTFTTAGTYTTTLAVTDNSGLRSSSTVTIAVSSPPVNSAPVAVATASPSSGPAPLTVSFSGTGSYDSDGTITSYQWTFGDGSSATGSTVSHVYQTAGAYTARLTVQDNSGATGTSTVTVSILKPMRVSAISLSATSRSALATVTVMDAAGLAVPNATVSGRWSGAVSGTVSGMTDASGRVSFTSKNYRKSGSVSFTITDVSKTGYYYDASQSVTSASM